jgi:signal peptidase II
MKRLLQLLLFAAAVLLVDFISKSYVQSRIPVLGWAYPIYPYGGIAVFQGWHGIDFSINHVINKGAAWGMLASFQDYLLYFRILIIGGMTAYLLFGSSREQKFPLSLIISGALGNVVDYFMYGHVIDMFYFKFGNYSFPVFNVADSAIFCGVSWMLLQSFLKRISSSRSSNSGLKTRQSSE